MRSWAFFCYGGVEWSNRQAMSDTNSIGTNPTLPIELQHMILDRVPVPDMLKLATTCRAWWKWCLQRDCVRRVALQKLHQRVEKMVDFNARCIAKANAGEYIRTAFGVRFVSTSRTNQPRKPTEKAIRKHRRLALSIQRMLDRYACYDDIRPYILFADGYAKEGVIRFRLIGSFEDILVNRLYCITLRLRPKGSVWIPKHPVNISVCPQKIRECLERALDLHFACENDS